MMQNQAHNTGLTSQTEYWYHWVMTILT